MSKLSRSGKLKKAHCKRVGFPGFWVVFCKVQELTVCERRGCEQSRVGWVKNECVAPSKKGAWDGRFKSSRGTGCSRPFRLPRAGALPVEKSRFSQFQAVLSGGCAYSWSVRSRVLHSLPSYHAAVVTTATAAHSRGSQCLWWSSSPSFVVNVI